MIQKGRIQYVVKLPTVVGDILIGPYASLFLANAFAGRRGQIIGVFDIGGNAGKVQEMTAQELQEYLECDTLTVTGKDETQWTM